MTQSFAAAKYVHPSNMVLFMDRQANKIVVCLWIKLVSEERIQVSGKLRIDGWVGEPLENKIAENKFELVTVAFLA